ncbi:MAG TPA: AraC family transcriptional regulator, partial [Candidatus Blautia stercoravium]|nr:AraC family transcriptional regulator [Candidatus Blautia stercoravium]
RFTTFLQQILWEENYTSEEYRADNVNALFQVLMKNIFLAYKERTKGTVYNPYRSRLLHLRLSLLSAPYENYELKEIAKQIGISSSYFQHLYSDTFGISFRADLISMRIEYAKELIQNTNLPIEKIAEKSGYSSEVHFYRQFQKETGFTPSAFRKISR